MKIKIEGHHTDAGPKIRDYIIEKTEGLERFFDRIVSVEVFLSVERERQIADFHAHLTSRKTINAREESTDMYASIDTAIDRLKRQLIKVKDQLQGVRDQTHPDASLHVSDETPAKKIIRSETYFQKPMTAEEAALQLDAIDKEFLVFVDVETDEIGIIYHRRDGNFGLIEPRR
ncbi:ribosome-associated translation inhibitor RaiA [Candidatus Bipolaricaulota bacterium]|nr:ribosome-associated translation inhibitor RaiA [Candidatus Bipolaricaulota bacterium]